MPHLIAYNLIKTAQDSQKIQRKNLIQYSAGGLRDFSRIAASNEIMWRDIFFNNDNIIKAINLFTKNLNSFKKIIQNKNNKKLLSRLSNSKKVRTQIVQLKQDVVKTRFWKRIIYILQIFLTFKFAVLSILFIVSLIGIIITFFSGP